MRRRVPLRLQSGLAECGAACLAMILSWYGRPTTVREIGDLAGVGRDGLSALAIVKTARQYGLEAKAFSLEPEDLAKIPLPAIVHWEFRHFVVLEAWTATSVSIADPAAGRRRLTHEEFDAGFTGVVLTFAPTERFRPGNPGAAPWLTSFLTTMLLRQRGLLGQILAISALLQVAGLAVQGFTKVLIDAVLPVHADRLLVVLGVGLAILGLIHLTLGYLRSTVLLNLRIRVDGLLTTQVIQQLFSLPYRYFVHRGTSDLIQRTASVSVLRTLITGQVTAALLDGPLALGYLVLVTVQAPALGGCLVAFALIQALVVLLTKRRIGDLTQRELAAQADAQGRLMEAIGGMETLKASGAERQAAHAWARLFVSYLNADSRVRVTENGVNSVLESIRFLAPAGLLWAGSWQVLGGDGELGATLALVGLAGAALAPISSLLSAGQTLQTVRTHVERLRDIMESTPEPRGQITVTELDGQIELDRVSFRYDAQSPWTLHEISLRVRAGEKVALVGRSGSGKSTLARVLLGLYEPSTGTIRYDGRPLACLDRASLRHHFGVVTQEPALFSGSIRENICLNRPDATLEEVVFAARMACIHDDISAMPMGYETMLSEGGGLSGGQRQRIALARALLNRPRVLLLDEATSHLDTVTEAAIDANLSRLTQTRIVIAHRLSTVRGADHIVVVNNGRIAEYGRHGELLALDGHYAALVSSQDPLQ
ncbi:peptidase domain-containing ABC transporter [Nonomuraea sp. NPDC003804]|uniref:peptidase domain-containing ABC transporter n=1 Tax=Nonomuraea sp. NPDC003804 TaxID=3154547 RepID=UPI0033A50500